MTVFLVKGYGAVHEAGCYAVRRAEGVRGIAPELDESEVAAFLKARRLDACGSCLKKYLAVSA